MKLRGVPIYLIQKIEKGKDAFGHPVFEEERILVENVLIAPASTEDITNQINLTGKHAVYTLAIPKGDQNHWENRQVEFFNQKWRTIGTALEGLDHMIPLNWNKKVMVERFE